MYKVTFFLCILDDKLVLNSGNIRVYCRVRPSFRAESSNIVDFIGEDGSLFILDPSKTLKDGRKLFQFNRVFGPTAGQGRVPKTNSILNQCDYLCLLPSLC